MEDQTSSHERREQRHWCVVEIGLALTMVAGIWAGYRALWVLPQQELEQKQKEFSLKLFDEKRTIYFEMADVVGRLYLSGNPEDMQPLYNRLEALAHGKYQMVIIDHKVLDASIEANNLKPKDYLCTVEDYLDAAKYHIIVMRGNDKQTKIKARYALCQARDKFDNALRLSIMLTFPDWKIGVKHLTGVVEVNDKNTEIISAQIDTIEQNSKKKLP